MLLAMAGLFILALFAVATVSQKLPFGLGRNRAAAAAAWSPYVVAARDPSNGTLTAAELWAIYNGDSAKADARFKNRPVSVTGTVADVRRDYHGDIMLRLATGDALERVRATIVNHDDSGRSVPVRGQQLRVAAVHGPRHGLIGSPVLDGCKPI